MCTCVYRGACIVLYNKQAQAQFVTMTAAAPGCVTYIMCAHSLLCILPMVVNQGKIILL